MIEYIACVARDDPSKWGATPRPTSSPSNRKQAYNSTSLLYFTHTFEFEPLEVPTSLYKDVPDSREHVRKLDERQLLFVAQISVEPRRCANMGPCQRVLEYDTNFREYRARI